MLKQRFAPALALALSAFAPSAQAFFDPPWIVPEQPNAGETVSIRIHGGVCDGIFETIGYPQITQDGNSIRFVVAGGHADDLNWCIFGDWTATFALGEFPPGDYLVTAEMRYTDFFANPAVLTIGTVGFSVLGAAAPAVPLPATSPTALAVQLMLVIGLALLAVRKRREHLLRVLLATASLYVRANR